MMEEYKMIINKTFKNIIKIKDLAYINDLGCEIIEYYLNNNTLNGRVYVTGAYHSSKTDEVKLISEDLEFLFELDSNDFYVEDIECINFEYSILEGVGINVLYEIKLNSDIQHDLDIENEVGIQDEVDEQLKEYDEKFENLDELESFDEVDNTDIIETRECINESYEDSLEKVKEVINKDVDQKLSNKLEIVNDNIPQNEVVFRSIKDENSVIKVVYFSDEKQLNEIAESNNISIDSLFKSNKKTDFNNKKRVIIKYGK